MNVIGTFIPRVCSYFLFQKLRYLFFVYILKNTAVIRYVSIYMINVSLPDIIGHPRALQRLTAEANYPSASWTNALSIV